MALLGAAVGIVLLIFGSSGTFAKESNSDEKNNTKSDLDPAVYVAELEERITEICSRVKGAGQVRAVVTLKGGYRAVYATDAQSSSSGYKSSTVLVGSGSSEGAVLICYENPEIGGIGIVCEGGDDPTVRHAVVALVSAAFDVGTNKIYVASAK